MLRQVFRQTSLRHLPGQEVFLSQPLSIVTDVDFADFWFEDGSLQGCRNPVKGDLDEAETCWIYPH
jgi:hypothetical protein